MGEALLGELWELLRDRVACVECGKVWRDAWELWWAFATDDDPPEVAFYCQDCGSTEFGESAVGALRAARA